MTHTLREANEDDVARAIERLGLELPIETPGHSLRLFREISGLPGAEDDAITALDGVYVTLPLTSAACVLEFYHLMLDQLNIEPSND